MSIVEFGWFYISKKMLLVVDIAVHFAKNLSNEEVNTGFVWEKTDIAWMNPDWDI